VDGGIKVNVGSVPHPMEEMHYIEWVEIIVGDKTCRKFFKPGDAPSVIFKCGDVSDIIVRAYCNLHGLWKA
jgi:superoxide reductase